MPVSIWEVLNSPIILTTISLLWGALVASQISLLLQKRSYKYQARMQYAKEILDVYYKYIRILRRGDPESLKTDEFDDIHVHMLSLSKSAKALFTDQLIADELKTVCDSLPTIRDYIINKKQEKAEKALVKVYSEMNIVIERIYQITT